MRNHRTPDLRNTGILEQADLERRAGHGLSTGSGNYVSADCYNHQGRGKLPAIVTAYSLRVRLEASSAVQIDVLAWSFMAEPSTAVQGGPEPLLAEALAVSVYAALSEPTYVTLVLPGSRTLSPVDQ